MSSRPNLTATPVAASEPLGTLGKPSPFDTNAWIDTLSRRNQYLVITGVLFFFTLLYGYLQELVCIYLFARQYSLFLTLVQFGGYTCLVVAQRGLGRGAAAAGLPSKRPATVPVKYAVGLAVSQALMQAFSNLAMQYLNYPAKVLFKSCRVLPTMVFGVAVFRKRYSRREWAAVGMLVCGLVGFMQADMHASPELHPMGIAFIVAALVLDAGILNVQDYCFTQFGSSEDEVVFASYAGGSLLLLAACLATGELPAALAFVDANFAASRAVPLVSLSAFATCGYGGVLCVTGLTRRFGPLVASLTTTARKAVTLILSFALFPKPVNGGHVLGAALFAAGIVVKATAPRRRRSRPPPPPRDEAGDGSGSSGGSGSSHGHGSSFGQHAPLLSSAPSCSELPSELPSRASATASGSHSPPPHLGAHHPAAREVV